MEMPDSLSAAPGAEVSTSKQEETVDGQNPLAVVEEIVSDAERREAVIARAKEVLAKEASEITPDDVRYLRQQMNNLRTASQAEDGAEAPAEDAVDEEFKQLLTQIREKKAAYTAQVDAQRAANLERKLQIIDEIAALAEDTDNVNRTFPRYRELQDEFNALGEVAPTEETGVWKKFQDAREKYSDNLKINKELRDYDFKKNLDSKQLLVAEAEKLVAEEDVIVAFRRLQELHDKWRRIGPVAKELREDLWAAFKNASAEVNKRYQAFFEERKEREAANELAKAELCAALEGIDLGSLNSFAKWDETTKTVVELQEKWRTLGFASRKANKELFARFRALCDKFFAAKAEYFKSTREELAKNLERKLALAERAEQLRESTAWKQATDEFVELQKEWKTIGAVAKKHSDAVWKRFQSACDAFFDAKKAATSGARQQEQENLKAKRAIIDELEAIAPDTPREQVIAVLKDVQERWKQIGHVPFRDKDKIYDTFRAKLDEIRDKLNARRRSENMASFRQSLAANDGDGTKAPRERERLARALDTRRQELRTYENNLGFLTAASKSGDSLLRDFERKAERLRADIAELEEKIKIIDRG